MSARSHIRGPRFALTNPEKCSACIACVYGNGEHAEWCENESRSAVDQDQPRWPIRSNSPDACIVLSLEELSCLEEMARESLRHRSQSPLACDLAWMRQIVAKLTDVLRVAPAGKPQPANERREEPQRIETEETPAC